MGHWVPPNRNKDVVKNLHSESQTVKTSASSPVGYHSGDRLLRRTRRTLVSRCGQGRLPVSPATQGRSITDQIHALLQLQMRLVAQRVEAIPAEQILDEAISIIAAAVSIPAVLQHTGSSSHRSQPPGTLRAPALVNTSSPRGSLPRLTDLEPTSRSASSSHRYHHRRYQLCRTPAAVIRRESDGVTFFAMPMTVSDGSPID